MYRVLIVDDEMIVRVGVCASIQWSAYGFEVIGTAGDGKEALKIFRERKPDLVFTDIKMPVMDGLEFMKIALWENPQCKFIILSCLNEVEYVKQALKNGAADYILKLSLKPETLVRLLCEMKESIEIQRSSTDGSGTEKESASRRRGYLYHQLMYGNLSEAEEQETVVELTAAFPMFQNAASVACCFLVDHYERASERCEKTDHRLFQSAVKNVIKEFLQELFYCDLHKLRGGELIALCLCERENCRSMVEMLQSRHININQVLSKHLNITVSMGISGPVDRPGELKAQIVQAEQAASMRFFHGPASFGLYEKSSPSMEQSELCKLFVYEELLGNVRMQDIEKAQKCIDQWIRQLQLYQHFGEESIRDICLATLYDLVRNGEQMGVHKQDILNFKGRAFNGILKNCETLEAIGAYYRDFIRHYIEIVFQNASISPDIERVKQYIHQHIEENIDLEKASVLANMSKAYFSTLFKKQCGENFSTYVNRVKMQKAYDLLLHSHITSSEAAYQVGILDDSYFSKLFKKYIGKSPRQIKARNPKA